MSKFTDVFANVLSALETGSNKESARLYNKTLRDIQYIQEKMNEKLIIKALFVQISKNLNDVYATYTHALFEPVLKDSATDALSYEYQKLFDNVYYKISSLQSVNTIEKEIKKLKSEADITDADKNLMAATKNIIAVGKYFVEIKDDMKSRIRSANEIRTPKQTAREISPEEYKTCSWCLNKFTLESDGTMHRHGYKHHGGYSLGCCDGVMFKCLEVSNEGLIAYIDSCEKALDKLNKEIASLPDREELRNPKFVPFVNTKVPPLVTKNEVKPAQWQRIIAKAENKVAFTKSVLKNRKTMLENWKPE